MATASTELPTPVWNIIANKVDNSLTPLSLVNKELRGVAKRVQKHRHDAILKTIKTIQYIDNVFSETLYEDMDKLQQILIEAIETAPEDMVGLTRYVYDTFVPYYSFNFMQEPAIALVRKFPEDAHLVLKYECDMVFDYKVYKCMFDAPGFTNHHMVEIEDFVHIQTCMLIAARDWSEMSRVMDLLNLVPEKVPHLDLKRVSLLLLAGSYTMAWKRYDGEALTVS